MEKGKGIRSVRRLPVYDVVLGEGDAVTAVSLVDRPAVESDWQAFSEADGLQVCRFEVQDEEQRKVLGCVLRADFSIYRRTESGYEYFIRFGRKAIEGLTERMFRSGTFNVNNAQHDSDRPLEGLVPEGYFIKDAAAGIDPMGFGDVADGSLFAVYRIEDDDLWKEVKDGTFNGFSVECGITLADTGIEESAAFSAGGDCPEEEELLSMIERIRKSITR